VYCDVFPSVTLVAPLNDTVTPEAPLLMIGGVGGSPSSTNLLCDTEGSATLVAAIVTSRICELVAGAV
jgi:hypothetical protein